MKIYILTSIILVGALITSCNKKSDSTESEAAKPDSESYDSRILGTWKYVGAKSYMRIEENGDISYFDDLDSDALRIAKWKVLSKDLFETRFDWLEDAKRKPAEEAEKIRKNVQNRPKDRYSVEKLSMTIGDNKDILLMGHPQGGGSISPWERVK